MYGQIGELANNAGTLSTSIDTLSESAQQADSAAIQMASGMQRVGGQIRHIPS
ncbi:MULTISPECIES: hypothetical protein [Burkholderia]|jgi:methyl-accepting chemotaxis protein|uniref:Methyl-accepting chemotaxis protein n=1 Tax=Burkholderia contaminans TaxID=488447 RepID=A0AAP1VEQ9_9BURK|nr:MULTISPECIES: hypothetical protein [Burkholderia]UTP27156.1 hypothetical protein NMB33_39950 [Burkholderia sp. FXe9]MBH9693101.1 hypothetical protein [Burkholderia contaminans]MBK1906206.1 hypothetical protein [Burkholderia contaminans]MBK1914235.1 hypothetical protein [Burkholderia contaminans]MBK1928119.1 hypothetical protein [Burkholderia contaminans]